MAPSILPSPMDRNQKAKMLSHYHDLGARDTLVAGETGEIEARRNRTPGVIEAIPDRLVVARLQGAADEATNLTPTRVHQAEMNIARARGSQREADLGEPV